MSQIFMQVLSHLRAWLPAVQMVLSVLLVVAVLLQARGTGVGGSFGGSGAVYRTRRGIEKYLFRSTVIMAILFAIVSLSRLVA